MSSDDLEQEVMRVLSAALDQPSDTREDWLRHQFADQPELIERVLKLLAKDQSASSLLRTGGARADAEDPEIPERAGNYKITDLIGQGGMGAVYKGERDTGDFEHIAAIKIVRPGLFSEALTARFERERQTLASLNHPGIAKLFDGGTLPDGSPYIVMELVDGISLGEWIETAPKDKNTRLELFEKVCDAVAHAHQNLIIHRDLTPSNVLVTNEADVKLIDFGIAKPQSSEDVDPAAGSNSLASLSFTPGFAAPERSQGAAANTLSDVYSLGKLLEVMLQKAGLDNDLEAIISKAAAPAPEHRYASISALYDDIHAYRTGYPVEARNGSAGYRFGKYFRRRRLLVTFAAASVLALTGAFVVTLLQYQRAEAALDRANARFEQARTLSRSLVFEAYDEFAEVSGTLKPRQKLADLLSEYVAQLAEDEHAPDDVLFDVGQLNSRLADMYGGLGMSNLGDTDKSLELLTAADAAFERLIEKDPNNTSALAEQIFVQRGLTMQNLIYRLNPETALEYNAKVLESAERGVALADENERTLLRHFWSGRTDRLQILHDMKEYETGLAEVREWQTELTPELNERFGGGGEEMAAYMAVQEAEFLNQLDRPEEAIAPLRVSEGHRVTQLENAPDNYYYQTQLMVTYMELARAYEKAKDFPQAVLESNKAIDLARNIKAQDPEDAGGIEGLNSTLLNHASFLFNAGQAEESLITATEALSLARQLDEQFPDDPYYQRILMNSLLIFAAASETDDTVCGTVAEATSLFEILSADEDSTEKNFSNTQEKLTNTREQHSCAP
ncbi:MAG: protein kinase domain-containing protein [Henriciella sp.]